MNEDGGALYVDRDRQGSGRHDNPDHYGALYASRVAQSAISERIQQFRGQVLADGDLRRADGRPLALAVIDDSRLSDVIDLDDPRELVRRRVRPSRVATRNREVTQALSRQLFEEGISGFVWWSTIEATWQNITLFAERAAHHLALQEGPEILSIDHPLVREAGESLGIGFAS